MIIQEKHGIPSTLPCYFTSKIGIPGKTLNRSKNMEYQQKPGILAKDENR
jgi:hypothetical protein